MDTNGDTKTLLLKDLCSRLPYGVILANGIKARSIDVLTKIVSGIGTDKKIEDTKYYLRPMSSMTKEEKFDIGRSLVDYGEGLPTDMYIDEVIDNSIVIDYLLERHFDYRGLIKKGLALPAPENMYKID